MDTYTKQINKFMTEPRNETLKRFMLMNKYSLNPENRQLMVDRIITPAEIEYAQVVEQFGRIRLTDNNEDLVVEGEIIDNFIEDIEEILPMNVIHGHRDEDEGFDEIDRNEMPIELTMPQEIFSRLDWLFMTEEFQDGVLHPPEEEEWLVVDGRDIDFEKSFENLMYLTCYNHHFHVNSTGAIQYVFYPKEECVNISSNQIFDDGSMYKLKIYTSIDSYEDAMLYVQVQTVSHALKYHIFRRYVQLRLNPLLGGDIKELPSNYQYGTNSSHISILQILNTYKEQREKKYKIKCKPVKAGICRYTTNWQKTKDKLINIKNNFVMKPEDKLQDVVERYVMQCEMDNQEKQQENLVENIKELHLGNGKLNTEKINEAIDQVLNGDKQATKHNDQNWLVAKLSTMFTDHITTLITSTWSGIAVTAGAITSAVATLVGTIFQVIDMIRNGVNSCRIIAFICSLVALLSQIAVAVGIVNLTQEMPNLIQSVTNMFGDFDTNTTVGELFNKLDDEAYIMQPDGTIAPAMIPFVAQKVDVNYDLTTNVDVTNLKVIKTVGNGWCGFDSLIKGLNSNATMTELRDFIANNATNQKVADRCKILPENGALKGEAMVDIDLLYEVASLLNVRICVVNYDNNNITTTTVTPDNPIKTIHLKFAASHYEYLSPTFQQAGLPSLETSMALGCGLTALGFSIAGMAGITGADHLSKRLVEGHKLRQVIQSNTKDCQQLVEAIAEESFGWHISKFSKLRDTVKDVSDRLSAFLENPNTYYASHPIEYFKFRDTLMEAKKVITSCAATSKDMPSYIQQGYTMLNANIQRGEVVFHDLGKVQGKGRIRQEPVPVMVVGRHGAGKTYFMRKYVIPKIQERFGLDSDVYALNFGGQIFFPPYSGQAICYYDEFLAQKENDPLVPHLNGICALDHYNIPGADVWTKVQECLFKMLFLTSNMHYVSLKNVLAAPSETALYSRMTRVEIINKTIPPHDKFERKKVQHSEDYSEFEIRLYKFPSSAAAAIPAMSPTAEGVVTENLPDPYKIITKEELVDHLIYEYSCMEATFNNTAKPIEGDQLATQKPVVIPPTIDPGNNPIVPIQTIHNFNVKVGALKKAVAFDFDLKLNEMKNLDVSGANTKLLLTKFLDIGLKEFSNLDTKQVKQLEDFYFKDVLPNFPDINHSIADKLKPIQQSDLDKKIDHMVVLMSGQTDTGKSLTATKMAYQLNKLLRLPVIEIMLQKLTEVCIEKPSIVVLHDKMNSEQDYINFYDSLPKPSIIINTNNLRFKKQRLWNIPSGVPIAEDCGIVSSIKQAVVNKLCTLRKYTLIEPHSTSTTEAGFARRIGVVGDIYHAGCTHFRPRETTVALEIAKYGRCIDMDTREEKTQQVVIDEIVSKFKKMYRNQGGITYEKGKVGIEDADLYLRFESIDQLREYVNNPTKMMSLYYKFATGGNKLKYPEIDISVRLQKSEFTFSPSMFYINDTKDLNSIVEMAERAYLLLMKGNTDFSCLLDIQTFKAYCKGMVITIEDKGSDYKNTIYDLNITRQIDTNNKYSTVVQVLEYDGKKESTPTVYCYSADEVMSVMYCGLQSIMKEMPVQHATFLLEKLEVIEAHEYMQIAKTKHKQVVLTLQKVVDETPEFVKIWLKFSQSKLFNIVKIMTCIIVAMLSIYTIFKISKVLYSWCKGDVIEEETKAGKKTKSKKYLYIEGYKVFYTLEEAGSKVNVQLECDEDCPVSDYMEADGILSSLVQDEFSEKHTLGVVKITHTQSESPRDNNKTKGSKRKPMGWKRKVNLDGADKSQAVISDSQMAVIDKIYKNGCWITGTRSNCYGLRWKGTDILTPAHIWNKVNDIGRATVVQYHGEAKELLNVAVMVYTLDFENDIAVVRIDKKDNVQQCMDLTNYFIREYDIPKLQVGALLGRNIPRAKREFGFATSTPMTQVGSISVTERNAMKIGDSMKRAFSFLRAGLMEILTAPGDCGLVYVSVDKTVDTKCIVGLHTNIMPSKRETLGSVITQEYLQAITEFKTVGVSAEKQGIYVQDDITVVEMTDIVTKPGFTSGVKHALTKYYEDWFDALGDTYVDEKDDIWYDAESKPTANVFLCGYDKKHKPSHIGKVSHVETPWSKDIEDICPKGKWLSITNAKDHSKPETLKTLGGKPSVLATQVDMFNDPVNVSDEAKGLLEYASECVRAEYKTLYANDLRILTDMEVINGTYLTTRDPLFGCLEPMDLDSSAGDYPKRRFGMTNKRNIFRKIGTGGPNGRDLYDWNNTPQAEDIRKVTRDFETYAVKGIRIMTPAVDAPKFEIIEKKDKSRLFSVLSLQETMLGRKYTGAIQAKIMQHRDKGHSQIGIYAIPGFHQLYDRFSKISNYGTAADFKRWDKHISSTLLSEAFDIVRDLYISNLPDSKDDITNVYAVMKDMTTNTLSICDGNVYIKIRGMPSGCPFTAFINGVVNDLMYYMCLKWLVDNHNAFLKTKPTDEQLLEKYGKEFHNNISKIRKPIVFGIKWVQEHFDWITYGDDIAKIISIKYLWLVNFVTCKEFYWKVLGLDYDSPSKDGTIIKFQPIEELNFISRTFRRENGLTFAALKKVTIESLLHWSRTSTPTQWVENMEIALEEGVLWGEEYYKYLTTVIEKILACARKANLKLSLTIIPYKHQLAKVISIIRDGTNTEILPKEPQQKVENENQISRVYALIQDELIDLEANIQTYFDNENINKKQKAIQQGDMDPLQACTHVHNALKSVKFQGRELTEYYNFPAYIARRDTDSYVSICYKGNTYTRYNLVQSDITRFITPLLPPFVTYAYTTVCNRSLDQGKTLTPIWQIALKVVPNMIHYPFDLEEQVEDNVTRIKKFKIKTTAEKSFKPQATGTQARAAIQDGTDSSPDGEVPMRMVPTRGVPKSDIHRTMWHMDMKEIAHKPMEALDSPISVAIATPMHTVIFRRTLDDITNMPPGMRAWTSIHSYSNATRKISIKFISAATLINELVVGISPVYKSTYTIQELQLVKWEALNPQDVTATVDLRLVDVAWGSGVGENMSVNRYKFQTRSPPTDVTPQNIPTAVIMTRVGIQNSFANPDVTIQMAITESFVEGGDFIVDQNRLNEFIPASSMVSTLNNGVTIADFLNTDPGTPIYITCDGGNLSMIDYDKPERIVKQNETSIYAFTIHGYWKATENTQDTPWFKNQMIIPPNSNFMIPLWLASDIQRPQMESVTQPQDIKDWFIKARDVPGYLKPRYLAMFTSLNGLNIQNGINPFDMIFDASKFSYTQNTPTTADFLTIVRTLIKDPDNFVISEISPSLVPMVVRIPLRVTTEKDEDASINTQGPGSTINHPDDEIMVSSTQTVAAFLIESNSGSNNVRILIHIVNNRVPDRPANTYDAVAEPIGTLSYYDRDVDDSNMIGPHMDITFRAVGTLGFDSRDIAGIVAAVSRPSDYTLDTNFSVLRFPLTIPKTISANLARTHVPIEFDDSGFLLAFERKIKSLGVVDSSSQIVMFNLNTVVVGAIAIVGFYNPQYRAFFINNNPTSDQDYYKTFRKLTHEDVLITNMRIVDKLSTNYPYTNTNNWINRVATPQQIFTGTTMTNIGNIRKLGKLQISYEAKNEGPKTFTQRRLAEKSFVPQAEEAIMAGGAITSQIFTAIFGYLAKKNLLDVQTQNQLKVLEAQFQQQEKMQQNQFNQQLLMSGLQGSASTRLLNPPDTAPINADGERPGQNGVTYTSQGAQDQPSNDSMKLIGTSKPVSTGITHTVLNATQKNKYIPRYSGPMNIEVGNQSPSTKFRTLPSYVQISRSPVQRSVVAL